jgi:hypothetical protein
MDAEANPARHDERSRALARRFLRIFAAIVAAVALLVASVNLVAYRFMLRDDNQDIVQLLAGWGRMYKPILFDELRPDIAVYGASWARDAFDPIETGRLVGRRLFNHAVSGGTAYETRRFGDSSHDNPELEAAIINLDTFYRSELAARNRYGFDESILDVDPEGRPNRWVGLRRGYSLALTGWAAGANLELISSILARDRGAARPDYLRAYESADLTRRRRAMQEARDRIFPEPGVPAPGRRDSQAREPLFAEPAELGRMIDGFCAHHIDIYAYFTPTHARQMSCDAEAGEEMAALDFLRRKQLGCGARIHYYDFGYANAVTLEGILTPVEVSRYYRPDNHPRPTVGLLMAARMFGSAFPPGTPELIERDFGTDLMAAIDAEGWLRDRAARCEGDWGEQGYAGFAEALGRL